MHHRQSDGKMYGMTHGVVPETGERVGSSINQRAVMKQVGTRIARERHLGKHSQFHFAVNQLIEHRDDSRQIVVHIGHSHPGCTRGHTQKSVMHIYMFFDLHKSIYSIKHPKVNEIFAIFAIVKHKISVCCVYTPAYAIAFSYINALMWAFVAAYAMLITTLIVAVLSENRNPLKALGWVMALLLFPVGGAVLYFVFGRSMRNVKMISRRNRRRLLNAESHRPMPKLSRQLSPENRRRIMLGYSVAEAMVYSPNSVEVINDGSRMFEALFDDLRRARKYINLQFYIIANDPLGRQLGDILIERAKAGVKIRVIYDYVGSFGSHSQILFNRLRSHGIEVHSFFRIQFPEKLGRLNWRNHRKAVIIDGLIGYIGGINVAQRYVDGGSFGCWRDMAVRLTGPGVLALQHNFAIDWKFMGYDLITDEPADSYPMATRERTIDDVLVQIIASGPTNRWGNTHMLFIKAISGAKTASISRLPTSCRARDC